MKKFIFLAFLLFSGAALFAADTDMYLFWMISEDATFDGKKMAASELGDYTARVSDGSQYLNLYSSNEDSSSVTEISAENVFGWDVLAGVGDYHSGSFFVELWKDSVVVYKSKAQSYASLSSYMSSMQGTAWPAETFGFSSFSAVPEPTSGLLILLGVAGLALRRRRA